MEKHSKIVAVVFPASIAFGCFYTLEKGTNPFTDLKSWATGARACAHASHHVRSVTPVIGVLLSRWPIAASATRPGRARRNRGAAGRVLLPGQARQRGQQVASWPAARCRAGLVPRLLQAATCA